MTTAIELGSEDGMRLRLMKQAEGCAVQCGVGGRPKRAEGAVVDPL